MYLLFAWENYDHSRNGSNSIIYHGKTIEEVEEKIKFLNDLYILQTDHKKYDHWHNKTLIKEHNFINCDCLGHMAQCDTYEIYDTETLKIVALYYRENGKLEKQ